MASPFRIGWLAILAILIALFDGAMKTVAIRSFPGEGEEKLNPLIALALHKNPGIAFDIPLPLWLITAATIIALIFLGHFIFSHYRSSPILALGAWLIAVGAIGNLIDRLINGFTTDYLILLRISAINLADILILTGAIVLLVYSKKQLPT